MTILSGWGARLFSDNKGPWGSSGGSGDGDEPPPKAPGPWGEPRKGRGAEPDGTTGVSSLDDWIKRRRLGGGGGNSGGGGMGGMPGRPSAAIIRWALLAFAALWLLLTTMHSITPGQRGVVTRLGVYSHTLTPGIGLTLPFPIDKVRKIDVENIQTIELGSASEETLMLTGDQNIIDIAYQVRWNIKDPELYLFELAQPDDTIREVAESAMRSVVANVTLQDAIGNKRGEIEAKVTEEMQQILDMYRTGVAIRGVAIKQADPPAAVNDAFKEVTSAQQDAQSYVNQANAYSLQLRQKSQGDATAFDKVYAQYKLAPGVTKQRMYYETMERVLQGVDKTIVEAPGVTSYLPLNELRRSPPKEPAQ